MDSTDNKEGHGVTNVHAEFSDNNTDEEKIREQQEQLAIAINNPQVEFDRNFLKWLQSTGSGILVSSYKTQKVFSLGYWFNNKVNREQLSMWLTDVPRGMGIAYDDVRDNIYINCITGLWKYVSSGKYEATKQNLGEYDSYLPRTLHCGSDIDAHDISIGKDGAVYFCSALFCCICTTSETHSFKIYWKPPWISKVAAEDRCHLNGLCCRDGVPRYVTSVSKTDVRGGWHENRNGKGIVYDIVKNATICSGLTMPHSPRWYNNTLWVLDAGTGWFGKVEKGKFVKCTWLPTFLRGLTFIRSGSSHFAIVGGSMDRHEQSFRDLPLGEVVKEKEVSIKCGLWVIDLKSFDVLHHLHFQSPVDEIYDVCALSGISRPMLMNLNDSVLHYTIEGDDFGSAKIEIIPPDDD